MVYGIQISKAKQTISMFIKQITFNQTLVQIRQSNKQQRKSLKVEVKINSKYFSDPIYNSAQRILRYMKLSTANDYLANISF